MAEPVAPTPTAESQGTKVEPVKSVRTLTAADIDRLGQSSEGTVPATETAEVPETQAPGLEGTETNTDETVPPETQDETVEPEKTEPEPTEDGAEEALIVRGKDGKERKIEFADALKGSTHPVKINGKVQMVDYDELVKGYQVAQDSQKRYEAARTIKEENATLKANINKYRQDAYAQGQKAALDQLVKELESQGETVPANQAASLREKQLRAEIESIRREQEQFKADSQKQSEENFRQNNAKVLANIQSQSLAPFLPKFVLADGKPDSGLANAFTKAIQTEVHQRVMDQMQAEGQVSHADFKEIHDEVAREMFKSFAPRLVTVKPKAALPKTGPLKSGAPATTSTPKVNRYKPGMRLSLSEIEAAGR